MNKVGTGRDGRASVHPPGRDPGPLVEVTRRDLLTGREVVESMHAGHLVVVDDAGRITASIGDPDAVIYPRSALKPLQAAICLELIAEVDADLAASLSTEEVAIASASHGAAPEQLAAVRSLAVRAGLEVDDGTDGSGGGRRLELSCPLATDPAGRQSHLAHNCSGKHAMFALTARVLGLPGDRASLLAHDGPLQSLLIARLADLLGPPRAVAVDGCGAPALALPLIVVARAFAALAREDRFARVRDAGLTHPHLIGGATSSGVPLVDSAILAAGGQVIAKRGAEGVLAAGWSTPVGSIGPGDHAGSGGGGGGIAVKSCDGAMRGVATAVITSLEDGGVVPAGTWREPAPTGGDAVAGEIRAVAPVVHRSSDDGR